VAKGRRRATPAATPVKPVKVAVAYVHGNEVAHSWHQSMQALIAYDIANKQHVINGGWFATRYGTGGIIQARNDTVHAFLTQCDADWLFWVDTDMGFAPDSVDRLLEAADPVERPIMGGLCFAMREIGIDRIGGYLVQPTSTIFDWVKMDTGQQGFYTRHDWERDEVTLCAGTGSAFLIIHRSVFEKIAAEYGNTWYSPVWNKSLNMSISEDLSFCSRAGALSIPVHVHTGVKTSHLKQAWVDERFYDRLERIGHDGPTAGS
jgi:GT2 family glycosyltransferase